MLDGEVAGTVISPATADTSLDASLRQRLLSLDQGTMLDELDEDVEGTSARLAAAQKRINHVLTKAGMRGQLCIIVFLIAVLAVLVVVAFS